MNNTPTPRTDSAANTMTPEQQRIAIAEACGWKPDGEKLSSGVVLWNKRTWINLKPYGDGYLCDQRVPDYLNDLNAMHEVEKLLVGTQRLDYIEWLGYCDDDYAAKLFRFIHATAKQRAEAFLKTIDKWTTNQPTEP